MSTDIRPTVSVSVEAVRNEKSARPDNGNSTQNELPVLTINDVDHTLAPLRTKRMRPREERGSQGSRWTPPHLNKARYDTVAEEENSQRNNERAEGNPLVGYETSEGVAQRLVLSERADPHPKASDVGGNKQPADRSISPRRS